MTPTIISDKRRLGADGVSHLEVTHYRPLGRSGSERRRLPDGYGILALHRSEGDRYIDLNSPIP